MYDIIFIGNSTPSFLQLKDRFPTAKRVKVDTTLLDAFDYAKKKAFTKMFWVVWDDIEIAADFKFDYKVDPWDEQYNHLFLNGNEFNGVGLFPKTADVSNRELTYRFFLNKKEISILASHPKPYDTFYINNHEEYLTALDTATTDMFWIIPDDVVVNETFNFSGVYFDNEYDKQINHVFLNGTAYDGIILASKKKVISKREFDYKFLVEKKEWDIVASYPKPYDKFFVSTYDDYLNALETTTTEMCWIIPNDVIVADDFKFDIYFNHQNQYDKQINHMFLNDRAYDGIILASKKKPISKREFDYKFLVERKEWDIIASRPKPYDKFYINTYDEYLDAFSSSATNMFWIIPDDVVVNEKFDFDSIYFDYQNQYDKQMNHVFLNGTMYDGIILASKKKSISNREFDYRFLVEKKEWNIVASHPKPYDVVFISYYEKFADEHFQKMLEYLQPNQSAYRVNGIKGIHNAHRCAAELAKTDMFWVVDADALLEPNFKFKFPQVAKHDTYTMSIVHVWRSRNPVNDLEYGYGGVKLLPRALTLNMDIAKPDMTTSISASFKSMPEVSNVAGFNTDPFTTWRSAFRECVKLASKTIQGQVDQETEERLDIWCTIGADRDYGEYAIAGAQAGRKYGQENAGNIPALALINDYDWLKSQYEQTR